MPVIVKVNIHDMGRHFFILSLHQREAEARKPCDSLLHVYQSPWRKVRVKDRKNAQSSNYLKLPPMTVYVLCFVYVR